ncbi:MAG: hypothetical protein JWN34_4768 [Bryobacterales bacterium]|nr:hypothetical protein [Bryobacterales bacterium]
MPGILVHGDNHFVVRGPEPDGATAMALVKQWSVIQIGGVTPPGLRAWQISTREFRENLEWAIVIRGDSPMTSAVTLLLDELSGRGLTIRHC